MTTEGGDGVVASSGEAAGGAVLVRLEVPVAPAYVGLARAVVISAVSVVPWLDDDRLEDLRLAVSEACTRAVAGHPDGSSARLRLSCRLEGDTLAVDVEDVGGHQPLEPPDEEAAWGPQLIRALVDDATFDSVEGGRRVRLAVRRPASP